MSKWSILTPWPDTIMYPDYPSTENGHGAWSMVACRSFLQRLNPTPPVSCGLQGCGGQQTAQGVAGVWNL